MHHAYARGATGEGIVIGVVDGGLDPEHPEFADRVAPGGWNFQLDAPVTSDPTGHGSAVSGIIVANRDGQGMHGVAPLARVLPVVPRGIGNTADSLSPTHLLEIIGAQIDGGARISNNSWSLPSTLEPGEPHYALPLSHFHSEDFTEIVATYRAGQDAGLLFVFSVGNNFTGDPDRGLEPGVMAALPAAFESLQDQWLAVASLNYAEEIGATSHRCGGAAEWCITAPGQQILSPLPGGGYQWVAGTSIAAAQVSGAAALLMHMFPTLTSAQVAERLLESADRSGQYADESIYGRGVLDLEAATRPIGTLGAITPAGIRVESWGGWHQSDGALVGSLKRGLEGTQVVLHDSLDAPFHLPAHHALLGAEVQPRSAEAIRRMDAMGAEASVRSLTTAGGTRVSMRERPSLQRQGRATDLTLRHESASGSEWSLSIGGRPSRSQVLAIASQGFVDSGVTTAFENPFSGERHDSAGFGWSTPRGRSGQWGIHVSQSQSANGGHMAGPGAIARGGELQWAGQSTHGWRIGVQAGVVSEAGQALGTQAAALSASHAISRYTAVDLALPFGDLGQLVAQRYQGRSNLRGAAWNGNARFATDSTALGWIFQPSQGLQVGLIAHRPLAASGGFATFELPTRLNADNTVGWETVQAPLGVHRGLDYQGFIRFQRAGSRLLIMASALHLGHTVPASHERDYGVMLHARIR